MILNSSKYCDAFVGPRLEFTLCATYITYDWIALDTYIEDFQAQMTE